MAFGRRAASLVVVLAATLVRIPCAHAQHAVMNGCALTFFPNVQGNAEWDELSVYAGSINVAGVVSETISAKIGCGANDNNFPPGTTWAWDTAGGQNAAMAAATAYYVYAVPLAVTTSTGGGTLWVLSQTPPFPEGYSSNALTFKYSNSKGGTTSVTTSADVFVGSFLSTDSGGRIVPFERWGSEVRLFTSLVPGYVGNLLLAQEPNFGFTGTWNAVQNISFALNEFPQSASAAIVDLQFQNFGPEVLVSGVGSFGGLDYPWDIPGGNNQGHPLLVYIYRQHIGVLNAGKQIATVQMFLDTPPGAQGVTVNGVVTGYVEQIPQLQPQN